MELYGAQRLLAAEWCGWLLGGARITGQVQDMADRVCLCSGCGFAALEAEQCDRRLRCC